MAGLVLSVGARLGAPASSASTLDATQEVPSRYSWTELDRGGFSGDCIKREDKYAQDIQDMRALWFVNCSRDGYYLDIGANDGESISNTYVMDVEFGWNGVCVEPFPTNFDRRSCSLYKDVVSDVSGHEVQFRHAGSESDNDVFGGIDENLQTDIRHGRGELFNFTTMTATDLLKKAHAPTVIDFASIDTEGAEALVMQGFDLETYCVRFIAIEHNNDEPKRSDIRETAENHGHTYHGTDGNDDFYTKECGAR
tara:strand:- start:480 stop:1238 length:759 start_codon:yes stop_codon:yes gene_type:complete